MPSVDAVHLNPPARELGGVNAVLWGMASRRHRVDDFEGPLSIKCVLRGDATWETRGGRYPLRPGRWLVLNPGRSYSLAIDAREPVETFCVFFRRGFVEDALRASSESAGRLLDQPEASAGPDPAFLETVHDDAPGLVQALRDLRADLRGAGGDPLPREAQLLRLTSELVEAEARLRGLSRRIAALRPSTRDELLRRALRGRDFVEANLAGSLTLDSVAREACLSAFHFHRVFRAVTGESLHRYVARRRLERARELLLATDLPVTRVAAEVGFESLGSFTTRFTRTFGSPPGRLRSQRGNPFGVSPGPFRRG